MINIEKIIIDAEKMGVDYTLAMLKKYVEEAKSYGYDLDADTFYDQFREYLMESRADLEDS